MIDPNMDSLVNYLMKLRGEGAPNPLMPPQQPQPEINPAVAGIMQMLQGQQAQQEPQNPMMAAQAVRPIGAVQRKWEQVSEAAQEPVVPAAQPAPEPEAQYVAPSKVKKMSDGTIKRWDSYRDSWVPMSPEEIKKYEAAGGVIGG